MGQLDLTIEQLLKIGFTKVVYPGDELNESKTVYEIPFLNGCFYYNPDQPTYKWYQKVIVGEGANYSLLDINSAAQLQLVLACFRVKFNLVII